MIDDMDYKNGLRILQAARRQSDILIYFSAEVSYLISHSAC